MQETWYKCEIRTKDKPTTKKYKGKAQVKGQGKKTTNSAPMAIIVNVAIYDSAGQNIVKNLGMFDSLEDCWSHLTSTIRGHPAFVFYREKIFNLIEFFISKELLSFKKPNKLIKLISLIRSPREIIRTEKETEFMQQTIKSCELPEIDSKVDVFGMAMKLFIQDDTIEIIDGQHFIHTFHNP